MSDPPSPSKRPRLDEEQQPEDSSSADSALIKYLQSQLDVLWEEVRRAEDAATATATKGLELENIKLKSRVQELEKILELNKTQIKALVDVSKVQQKLIKRQSNTIKLYNTTANLELQADKSDEEDTRLTPAKPDTSYELRESDTSTSIVIAPTRARRANTLKTPKAGGENSTHAVTESTAVDLLESVNGHLALCMGSIRACATKLASRDRMEKDDLHKLQEEYTMIRPHISKVQSLYDSLRPGIYWRTEQFPYTNRYL